MSLISNWLSPSFFPHPTHIQLPPPFSHACSVVSTFFSHFHVVSFFSHIFSCLHPLSVLSIFFSHTFSYLPLFSPFSCLPFFLTHLQFPPLFSHSCSVVSTFFSKQNTFSCLPFSHTSSVLSYLQLFFTLSVLSFFSHTFCCLLFSQTHSVAFAIQKNIVPLFLNTLSVPSPFFSVPGLPSPFKKIYTFQLPSLF